MEAESARAFQIPKSPSSDDLIGMPTSKTGKTEQGNRKVICRYGCGCTHLSDTLHREKFWHPKVQQLRDEQIQSHFICNECSYATSSLADLQLHLRRKTAWSNSSLIGCRINCLVDYKEWHEGFVTQFHKSGKHLVEFRMVNEKRWLQMKKIAFYIVERTHIGHNDDGEFKDDVEDEDGLAPLEDNWVYVEEITLEYAFAQSVLFKVCGNSLQETGHLTKGHVSLTESDRSNAQGVKSSLLYGELLPRGANKAFGANRLEVHRASSLFDLGMGTGKIVLQAFLQFKTLRYVYGVELSAGRYKLAEEATVLMVKLLGNENYQVQQIPGKSVIVTEISTVRNSDSGNMETVKRILHLECGNMFDVQNIHTADVVMMETDIPTELHPDLYKLLINMKNEARMLSYLDFRKIFEAGPLPLRQLEINRQLSDRYPTSWSVQRGHHFFLWCKIVAVETNTGGWNNMMLGHGHTVASNQAAHSPSSQPSANKQNVSLERKFIEEQSSPTSDELDNMGNNCLPSFRWFGGSNSRRKVIAVPNSPGPNVANQEIVPMSPSLPSNRDEKQQFQKFTTTPAMASGGTIVGNSSTLKLDENSIPLNSIENDNDPMMSISQDIRNNRLRNVQRVADSDKKSNDLVQEQLVYGSTPGEIIQKSNSPRNHINHEIEHTRSSQPQDQRTSIPPIENLERENVVKQKVELKSDSKRETCTVS